MTQHISPSRIATLNHCARQHHYKYTLGLKKKGPETVPQSRGKAIHTAIENMYEGNPVPRMQQEEQTWSGDYNAAVDAYGLFSMLNDRALKTVATELKFDVPLEEFPGWTLRGIIDHVAEIDGELWVGDHKSLSRKWPIEQTGLNLQHKIYEMVVPDLFEGRKAAGSFYNFIQLGTRAGVPYANVNRVMLPSSEQGLVTAYEEIESAINRIEAGDKHRNVGGHCGWCDFFSICNTDYFNPKDSEYIKQEYYEPKDAQEVSEELI